MNDNKNVVWKGLKKTSVVLGSVLLAAALTACGASGQSTSGSSTKAGSSAASSGSSSSGSKSSAPIKIGEIGALSGNLASLGTWDSQGLQMVVDKVNASGGIHGRKIQITKLDDQGSPSVAVNDAKKLINDGVVAAIATPESTTTLATIPIFQRAQVPQITAGENPQLTQKGSQYIFRDDASSDVFNKTLVDYVVNTLGLKKIAMITNTGSFGQGNHDSFLADLKAQGVKPVADEVVDPNAKDFSAQLTKIKAANPQALFIGTEEIEMGLIAKQARALGIKAKIIAGQGADTQIYLNTAGASVANGTIFDTTYVSNDATSQSQAFAAAYQKQFGKVADSHVAKGYDGATMLVEALKNAYPKLDGPHIATALHNLSYSGLTGNFKFNSAGEGLFKTTMGTIKNGKPVPLN